MYNLAVIGDRDSVLGFKALGLETVAAENAEEGRAALRRLESCGIIYITEKLASELKEDIARYADRVTPAVIPIPGKTGSLGIGMNALTKAVERAVGADILKG